MSVKGGLDILKIRKGVQDVFIRFILESYATNHTRKQLTGNPSPCAKLTAETRNTIIKAFDQQTIPNHEGFQCPNDLDTDPPAPGGEEVLPGSPAVAITDRTFLRKSRGGYFGELLYLTEGSLSKISGKLNFSCSGKLNKEYEDIFLLNGFFPLLPLVAGGVIGIPLSN